MLVVWIWYDRNTLVSTEPATYFWVLFGMIMPLRYDRV